MRYRPTKIRRCDNIALDSRGITLSNSGEWLRRKWRGDLKHRGWIKVHIAVDVNKKELVAVEVSDHRTNDDKLFKKLMKQCKENLPGARIKRVLADSAYDKKSIFSYLKYHKIETGIKMRKDAKAIREVYSYRSKCV
ncbi:MAG: transposase [Thermoplasmatota archaeon]